MRKNDFAHQVYKLVKKIPKGKVATYGQIAQQLGKPKAARAVGNALHQNPNPQKIPCYRVVDHLGKIAGNYAFGGGLMQKKQLRAEGIEFKDKNHLKLKYITIF